MDALNKLRQLAQVSAILFHKAGVAIQFYEPERSACHKCAIGLIHGNCDRWGTGLTVYGYHATVKEAISAELKRLGK